MINVILCGGSGARLWPLSRTLHPKQFNRLVKNESLFQMTVSRNHTLCNETWVISNEKYYFLARDHLEELGLQEIKFLLEPVGRNTAPAIALACMLVDPEELVLLTPSDHVIKDIDQYYRCVKEATHFALLNHLVTFGIQPAYAETGYGYMEADGNQVTSFTEKPDLETAKHYIEQGNYYWNSGMYVFKSNTFLEELRLYQPTLYDACKSSLKKARIDNEIVRIRYEDMVKIPAKSVDYAVIEQSKRIKMIAAQIGWSDLGSFEAWDQHVPKDKEGNTASSQSIHINSRNNLIVSSNRVITTVDVNDLIIVDTPDALLLSRKGSSQHVKKVVEKLKQIHSPLCDNYRTAYYSWGNDMVVDQFDKCEIRKVMIKPGKKLDLQKHFHCVKHWIVVRGTALIIVNGDRSSLQTNESIWIRTKDEHSVENPGKMELHLLEVQIEE